MNHLHDIPLAYRIGDDLTSRVRAALEQVTGRTAGFTIDDLAPVDGFHIRGRLGTATLAKLAGLGRFGGGGSSGSPGTGGHRNVPTGESLEILDVGSGPGGSARYLAVNHGCNVIGLDVTPAYVDLAKTLSELTGLSERTSFQVGSATAMPFEDSSFDVVWSEHLVMNIRDKAALARELSRVLRPGGRLVMHEVFSGEGDPPLFPVPWAEASTDSALVPASAWRQELEEEGLAIEHWEDVTRESATWFSAMVGKRMANPGGPSPLGLQLLMGKRADEKLGNLARNLTDGRVTVVMLVAQAAGWKMDQQRPGGPRK